MNYYNTQIWTIRKKTILKAHFVGNTLGDFSRKK